MTTVGSSYLMISVGHITNNEFNSYPQINVYSISPFDAGHHNLFTFDAA